jgi:hypothetical protein
MNSLGLAEQTISKTAMIYLTTETVVAGTVTASCDVRGLLCSFSGSAPFPDFYVLLTMLNHQFRPHPFSRDLGIRTWRNDDARNLRPKQRSEMFPAWCLTEMAVDCLQHFLLRHSAVGSRTQP